MKKSFFPPLTPSLFAFFLVESSSFFPNQPIGHIFAPPPGGRHNENIHPCELQIYRETIGSWHLNSFELCKAFDSHLCMYLLITRKNVYRLTLNCGIVWACTGRINRYLRIPFSIQVFCCTLYLFDSDLLRCLTTKLRSYEVDILVEMHQRMLSVPRVGNFSPHTSVQIKSRWM